MGEIALDVVDDGVGFVPGQVAADDHADDAGGGFGLAAMRVRALALGGTMTVESAPGRGTALAASFPRQRATALPGGPDTSPPGGPDTRPPGGPDEEAPVPT